MRIRILKNTVVNGKAVTAGALVATNERDARLLVAIGKAAYHTEQPEVETADMEPEEKAVSGRGRGRKDKEQE